MHKHSRGWQIFQLSKQRAKEQENAQGSANRTDESNEPDEPMDTDESQLASLGDSATDELDLQAQEAFLGMLQGSTKIGMLRRENGKVWKKSIKMMTSKLKI